MRKSFWGVASAAGRRCAVDRCAVHAAAPGFQRRAAAGIRGSRHMGGTGFASAGAHQRTLCELRRATASPLHVRSASRALQGARPSSRNCSCAPISRRSVLRNLMARERWDLFFAVYGDAHCAAHQLWPARENGKLVSSVDGFSDPWEPLRRLHVADRRGHRGARGRCRTRRPGDSLHQSRQSAFISAGRSCCPKSSGVSA